MASDLDQMLLAREGKAILKVVRAIEATLRQHIGSTADQLFDAVSRTCEAQLTEATEAMLAMDRERAKALMAEVAVAA